MSPQTMRLNATKMKTMKINKFFYTNQNLFIYVNINIAIVVWNSYLDFLLSLEGDFY